MTVERLVRLFAGIVVLITVVGNTVALVSAITMDKIANAIGPFELTEYLGLALVWAAFAVTAPFLAAGRPLPSTA